MACGLRATASSTPGGRLVALSNDNDRSGPSTEVSAGPLARRYVHRDECGGSSLRPLRREAIAGRWTPRSGTLRGSKTGGSGCAAALRRGGGAAWSRAGRLLALGHADGSVVVADPFPGKATFGKGHGGRTAGRRCGSAATAGGWRRRRRADGCGVADASGSSRGSAAAAATAWPTWGRATQGRSRSIRSLVGGGDESVSSWRASRRGAGARQEDIEKMVEDLTTTSSRSARSVGGAEAKSVRRARGTGGGAEGVAVVEMKRAVRGCCAR